jgi:hypothetical protein
MPDKADPDFTGKRCAVCGKEIWPNCGHTEGYTSEQGDETLDGEDEDYSDVTDVGYRGRGRPRLPPEQKRREKLVIALTGDELRRFMIEAASAEGGPLRVQDWARRELLKLAPERKK